MFGATGNETGKESEQLLQEILEIQRFLFDSLGLHFRFVSNSVFNTKLLLLY